MDKAVLLCWCLRDVSVLCRCCLGDAWVMSRWCCGIFSFLSYVSDVLYRTAGNCFAIAGHVSSENIDRNCMKLPVGFAHGFHPSSLVMVPRMIAFHTCGGLIDHFWERKPQFDLLTKSYQYTLDLQACIWTLFMMPKSPKDELSRGLHPWFQRPPFAYEWTAKWVTGVIPPVSGVVIPVILYYTPTYLYLVGALLVEKKYILRLKNNSDCCDGWKNCEIQVEVGSFSHDELYKNRCLARLDHQSVKVKGFHSFIVLNPASGPATAIGQSLDRRWGGSRDRCQNIPVKQWNRLDFWFLRQSFWFVVLDMCLAPKSGKEKTHQIFVWWVAMFAALEGWLFTEMTRPAFKLAQAVYLCRL